MPSRGRGTLVGMLFLLPIFLPISYPLQLFLGLIPFLSKHQDYSKEQGGLPAEDFFVQDEALEGNRSR